MIRFASMDAGSSDTVLLDFALSERIEITTTLSSLTSVQDLIVLVTQDSNGSRNICLAPTMSDAADATSDIRVAYRSQIPRRSGTVVRPQPTVSVMISPGIMAVGYSKQW